MGAAVSGHSSSPDHRGRLKRADGNDAATARCGVCQDGVEVSARVRVHRCRKPGCRFVLHDGCFRLPAKIKRHFAHPGHRLALVPVAGGHSCAAAAAACAAGGFRAHPRCCHLPEKMLDEKLHPHGRLVLRPPPLDGGGGGASRKCLKCGKAADGRTAAWSYQCNEHNDMEICLACVLGNGDDAPQGCCVRVDPGCIGEGIGALLCGIGQGMGLPGFTTAETAPAIRK
ncbi:hypothetical protein EJB05_48001, partial [Eragrostis curvula]